MGKWDLYGNDGSWGYIGVCVVAGVHRGVVFNLTPSIIGVVVGDGDAHDSSRGLDRPVNVVSSRWAVTAPLSKGGRCMGISGVDDGKVGLSQIQPIPHGGLPAKA